MQIYQINKKIIITTACFFILAKQNSPQNYMFSTFLFLGDFFKVSFYFQIRMKPFFEVPPFQFELECQEFKRLVLSLIKSSLTVLISRKDVLVSDVSDIFLILAKQDKDPESMLGFVLLFKLLVFN